ncbi:MATE family efflux transporter [Bacteroides sp. OF04-15BH]|mgnify:FL=1|uniref:MATE family efflux transporter n=1 Tax=Bacteroides sp. OF04-15BH TaxID=2292281 RepID=UPI000E4DE03A|nr:MATE family efflux transporter [Bacteroides sp. OF04-15BH]RHP62390.1 MATE family efflux transporter [Bacteroides sp. OF04-15BH]
MMNWIKKNEILNIALPSILSNITVPLLSLVDLTIVGHLGASTYIAAIAVGGTVFNMLYWVFGFLRMGTTGITAQHYGAGQQDEVTATLLRSLALAVAISLLQLLLQEQVLDFAFRVMETGPDVALYVNQYFHICIWGAPAMLMQYCFFGWFIAVQEARFPLYVSIFQNVVNIVCSAVFVFVLHWSVRGVALGTLIAQWGSVALSAVFLAYWLRRHRDARFFEWRRLLDVRALLRLFDVNKDIFLRTLCLVCVTLYFTSVGTEQGEVVLSANVFLMQFFTFYSYFMDGFAYAGESLTGKYYGARQMDQLRAVFIRLFRWGGSIALVFTLLYAAGGRLALTWLTDNPDVIDTAAHYLWWVILIPFVSVAAFLWDGIFIGLTATRQMLLSMFVAGCLFFLILLAAPLADRNNTLWLAFLVYLFSRGMVQTLLYRKKIRRRLTVWKG